MIVCGQRVQNIQIDRIHFHKKTNLYYDLFCDERINKTWTVKRQYNGWYSHVCTDINCSNISQIRIKGENCSIYSGEPSSSFRRITINPVCIITVKDSLSVLDYCPVMNEWKFAGKKGKYTPAVKQSILRSRQRKWRHVNGLSSLCDCTRTRRVLEHRAPVFFLLGEGSTLQCLYHPVPWPHLLPLKTPDHHVEGHASIFGKITGSIGHLRTLKTHQTWLYDWQKY